MTEREITDQDVCDRIREGLSTSEQGVYDIGVAQGKIIGFMAGWDKGFQRASDGTLELLRQIQELETANRLLRMQLERK